MFKDNKLEVSHLFILWRTLLAVLSNSAWLRLFMVIFLICVVGGGIKVHLTLQPLNGLLCQPSVIMIMEKSVE
jgi:hypothetical protein